MIETGKIINGDCVEVMKTLPEGSVDLNCHYHLMGLVLIMMFTKMIWNLMIMLSLPNWLSEAYRLLKDDGRIALNIPYEINRQKKGGRIFFVSEMWQIMKEIGYGFFGIVDLEEQSPHRSKTTAWGSWMSPSSPYIYNPKECVILAYKNKHIKKVKGEPQWTGVPTEIEQEDGTFKKKVVYEEQDKKEFMELVFGQWNYFADTKSLTKATFSMDIPTKAIKILSYKNDIVLDPFAGSGTSLVAAEVLGRRWLGIELSPNYCEIAKTRVHTIFHPKRMWFFFHKE
jgi:site-specific DNA-methyltransferase (adenine-specific)